MPQLKVQNFYSTALTSDITGTGDTSFTVTVAPTFTSGFLVISPNNASLREIVYFHNVVGNTVSVRAENRGQGGTTARAHTSQEPVAMKDVSEIFNFFSDALSQCFYVEKIGGLNVKIWGGTVFYNGLPTTVADTNLTLSNNNSNYIKYSYQTNTITVDTVNSGNIKAKVTTSGGAITSIELYPSKESYLDPSLDILTGAGVPSNSLGVDGCLYIDSSNGYLYKKISGAFVYQFNMTGATGATGSPGLVGVWRGDYNGGTSYSVNDVVYYNGSSYICILASTGNVPTNSTYWALSASKGSTPDLLEVRSLL